MGKLEQETRNVAASRTAGKRIVEIRSTLLPVKWPRAEKSIQLPDPFQMPAALELGR